MTGEDKERPMFSPSTFDISPDLDLDMLSPIGHRPIYHQPPPNTPTGSPSGCLLPLLSPNSLHQLKIHDQKTRRKEARALLSRIQDLATRIDNATPRQRTQVAPKAVVPRSHRFLRHEMVGLALRIKYLSSAHSEADGSGTDCPLALRVLKAKDLCDKVDEYIQGLETWSVESSEELRHCEREIQETEERLRDCDSRLGGAMWASNGLWNSDSTTEPREGMPSLSSVLEHSGFEPESSRAVFDRYFDLSLMPGCMRELMFVRWMEVGKRKEHFAGISARSVVEEWRRLRERRNVLRAEREELVDAKRKVDYDGIMGLLRELKEEAECYLDMLEAESWEGGSVEGSEDVFGFGERTPSPVKGQAEATVQSEGEKTSAEGADI
jgi:hypothetical protein